MARSMRVVAVALVLLFAACQRSTFDWEQKEDFMLSQSEKQMDDGSVRMEFVSLVNAPADGLFQAFSDVERHAEFIEGVSESKLVKSDGVHKVVDITNQILGRPNRAKIEWTIDEPSLKMSFKTVEAQFTDNSAEYAIDASPDGKRSRITTIYFLRDKGGHPFPLHSLRMAIRDSYVAAVSGLKRRALGPKRVVGPDS